jgi:hypothetical protein
MATTTTNYGFDIPQSTDLVKDGATAIATLGQDIDTAMNTALGTKKAGMVLLNTTSFSGVASQAAPTNVFTSTYRNYKVLLSNLTSSVSSTELRLRLRISGVDTTTSTYTRYAFNSSATSLTNAPATEASFYIGGPDSTSTNTSFAILEFFNPQVATRTQVKWDLLTPIGNFYVGAAGLQTDAGSQFDSFNIFPASGTISGQMQIFGYNQ